MTRSKVFIASSSEGLNVANKVQVLLLRERELDKQAEVKLWNRAFDLTATYY